LPWGVFHSFLLSSFSIACGPYMRNIELPDGATPIVARNVIRDRSRNYHKIYRRKAVSRSAAKKPSPKKKQ